MVDLSFLSISWPTAFAIVGSIMTIVGGMIKILSNRKVLPRDYSKEVEAINRQLREMDHDITSIQAALEGKVDIQTSSLQRQLDDLKIHYDRLHQKMERLTNIIIGHFSDR